MLRSVVSRLLCVARDALNLCSVQLLVRSTALTSLSLGEEASRSSTAECSDTGDMRETCELTVRLTDGRNDSTGSNDSTMDVDLSKHLYAALLSR